VFLISLATQRHTTRRWKRRPLSKLENYVFISLAQCSDRYRADSYGVKRCYRIDSYLKLSLSQPSAMQVEIGLNAT